MRLLLIVGLIALGAWWGFGKVKDAIGMKDAKQAISTASSSAPHQLSGFPQSVQDSSGSRSSVQPDKPIVSRVVNFRFRNPPSQDYLTSLASFGVVAAYDSSARSVLVRGTFSAVTDVCDLLASGDIVPGSCSARGWVVWIADTDSTGYDFTAALTAITSDTWHGSLDSSGLVLNIGLGKLSAAFRALVSDSRIHLVQEPHLRLMDSVPSKVESVEEVPIRSTTVSNGLATTSIEFKRVGLSLEINPSFLARDRVRLTVAQTGGLVGRTVQIDGAEVPVLQTQNVSTSVELTIGQAVVLGGVRSTRLRNVKGFFKNTTETETGVLYVCLALYDDTPKAGIVRPVWFDGIDQTDGIEGLDGMVLPPKKSK